MTAKDALLLSMSHNLGSEKNTLVPGVHVPAFTAGADPNAWAKQVKAIGMARLAPAGTPGSFFEYQPDYGIGGLPGYSGLPDTHLARKDIPGQANAVAAIMSALNAGGEGGAPENPFASGRWFFGDTFSSLQGANLSSAQLDEQSRQAARRDQLAREVARFQAQTEEQKLRLNREEAEAKLALERERLGLSREEFASRDAIARSGQGLTAFDILDQAAQRDFQRKLDLAKIAGGTTDDAAYTTAGQKAVGNVGAAAQALATAKAQLADAADAAATTFNAGKPIGSESGMDYSRAPDDSYTLKPQRAAGVAANEVYRNLAASDAWKNYQAATSQYQAALAERARLEFFPKTPVAAPPSPGANAMAPVIQSLLQNRLGGGGGAAPVPYMSPGAPAMAPMSAGGTRGAVPVGVSPSALALARSGGGAYLTPSPAVIRLASRVAPYQEPGGVDTYMNERIPPSEYMDFRPGPMGRDVTPDVERAPIPDVAFRDLPPAVRAYMVANDINERALRHAQGDPLYRDAPGGYIDWITGQNRLPGGAGEYAAGQPLPALPPEYAEWFDPNSPNARYTNPAMPYGAVYQNGQIAAPAAPVVPETVPAPPVSNSPSPSWLKTIPSWLKTAMGYGQWAFPIAGGYGPWGPVPSASAEVEAADAQNEVAAAYFKQGAAPVMPTNAPTVTPNYGARPDGTTKGPGFLGEVRLPDGRVATEVSVGIKLNGKQTDVPALVPTLTPAQVDFIRSGGDPREDPEIVQKAADHAKARVDKGLSPFKGVDRIELLPPAKQTEARRILKSKMKRADAIKALRALGLEVIE